ncbi:MAG: hypothetical protein ACLFQS_08645 [Bacteroidales bacterium]
MERKKSITVLVLSIALISFFAAYKGIFSEGGAGSFTYESIRGKVVEIYGEGLYRHMSADVAIQGIGQDYVTLFAGIPLLLFALIWYRKGSLRGLFLLAGTAGYFFVTYWFYTAMGMYNTMFLGYVALMGLSFFTLFLSVSALPTGQLSANFSPTTPHRLAGGFLIFNAVIITLLWLQIVVPPLFDGTIYPDALEHYTTLIVQGFDLGLLLPLSFVVGWLLFKRKDGGYRYAPVYYVFLTLLMTALSAKILAMALHGVNVIPVIFIIPAINIITLIITILLFKNIVTRK